MSFASLPFLVFLPTVFALHWAIPNRRYQNAVLVVASLFFYGWWDARFLALIVSSAILDYWVGRLLSVVDKKRGLLLLLSLVFNLGMLGIFKYYDFFASSLNQSFQGIGVELNIRTLNLILPLGISFYTFQTLSYSIDVYKNECKAVRDPIQFFAFVTFFPQLVAGPIERASRLLPQFGVCRSFDWKQAQDGCRQALWGFCKKMIVADTLAGHVDKAFQDPGSQSPWVLMYASLFFALQIYCDFSGYSDIAIGLAKTFGVKLSRNFKTPYFSRNIREFWQNWHISLSTWFRDYVYLPLGGNRVGTLRWIFNISMVFLVSGLWHGANWTFVVWGGIHALFFFVIGGDKKKNEHAELKDVPAMLLTFIVVSIAWVFFRANSVGDAFVVLTRIPTLFVEPFVQPSVLSVVLCVFVLSVEWLRRKREHVLEFERAAFYVRWPIYYLIGFAIVMMAKTGGESFIYFQF